MLLCFWPRSKFPPLCWRQLPTTMVPSVTNQTRSSCSAAGRRRTPESVWKKGEKSTIARSTFSGICCSWATKVIVEWTLLLFFIFFQMCRLVDIKATVLSSAKLSTVLVVSVWLKMWLHFGASWRLESSVGSRGSLVRRGCGRDLFPRDGRVGRKCSLLRGHTNCWFAVVLSGGSILFWKENFCC